MPWPLSQDYNEAIQSPASNFADADLRRGEAVTNAMGLPMPCSGNFADVYQVRCPDGSRWAVKCFTREVPGLRERYQLISAHLKQAKLPFTVDFSYLDQGIRVAGKWYPILKMQWVEGQTFNQYVSKNLDKPAKLDSLAQIWTRMGQYLRAAQVAHCDLQHGNVLLVPGANALALKLIDYDGMWVPALAGTKSGEVGHANYQHPRRLREASYSLDVDRFPLLLVATSLHALKVGGAALWRKYDNADNLLFKEIDLREPVKSPLFYDLTKTNDPVVKPMLHHLLRALRGGLETTPLLEEVLPQTTAIGSSRPSRLAITVVAPVAPSAAPIAPIAPIAPVAAPVAAAAGWDFVKPASETGQPMRQRRRRATGARANAARIGAVAAAVVVVLGLLGGLAFWSRSAPSQQPSPEPAPVEPPPKADAVFVFRIDQPGAAVSVDGKQQDVEVLGNDLPVKIPVKPGRHNVSVSKEGFVTQTKPLTATEGQLLTIHVHLLSAGPNPVGVWRHGAVGGRPSEITLLPNGTIKGTDATWTLANMKLTLRWPNRQAPGGAWIDRCTLSEDGATYRGANQKGAIMVGTKVSDLLP